MSEPIPAIATEPTEQAPVQQKTPEPSNPSESDKTPHPTKKKKEFLMKGKYIESNDKYKFSGSHGVQLRKKNFLFLLSETMGHIGNAAKKANISRCTHSAWIEGDPEYKRAYEDNCEYMKDEFEYLLKKQAYNNSTKATIFFLKTKAKERGYLETQKHINEHSGEINIPQGIIVNLMGDPKYEKEKEERNKLFAHKNPEPEEKVSELSDKEKPDNPS